MKLKTVATSGFVPNNRWGWSKDHPEMLVSKPLRPIVSTGNDSTDTVDLFPVHVIYIQHENHDSDSDPESARPDTPEIQSPANIQKTSSQETDIFSYAELCAFEYRHLLEDVLEGVSGEQMAKEIIQVLNQYELPFSIEEVINSRQIPLAEPNSDEIAPIHALTQSVQNIVAARAGHTPICILPGLYDIEAQTPPELEGPSDLKHYLATRSEIFGSVSYLAGAATLGIGIGILAWAKSAWEDSDDRPFATPQYPYFLLHLSINYLTQVARAATSKWYRTSNSKSETATELIKWTISPVGTGMSEAMIYSLSQRDLAAEHPLPTWAKSLMALTVSGMGSLAFVDGWYQKDVIESAFDWINSPNS
ncbi:hypothetical protein EBR57_01775 [bacterium]|nr:hypothetical protein [bacterium]